MTLTLDEVGETVGITRGDDEAYYVFLDRVARAYLKNPAFHPGHCEALIRTLTNAVVEVRNLNIGIIAENSDLKRKLQEIHNVPYGRRTDAVTPPDESRDPSKTFHYDIDPRARAVIRNGAYVLTIQPDDE